LTSERVHACSIAVVNDTVQRVTERPARTLETFLTDSEAALTRAV
jgi:hypothetical protein